MPSAQCPWDEWIKFRKNEIVLKFGAESGCSTFMEFDLIMVLGFCKSCFTSWNIEICG